MLIWILLLNNVALWFFTFFGFYFLYTQQKAQEERLEKLLKLNHATVFENTSNVIANIDYNVLLGATALFLVVVIIAVLLNKSSDTSIDAAKIQLDHLSKQFYLDTLNLINSQQTH
jgi:hypothetical protein